MKNRLFFRLLVLAVATVFAVSSCKDYDDDVNKLQTELNDLKSSFPKQITDAQGKLNSVLSSVKSDLEAAKKKVATLEAKTATKEEVQAAKKKLAELEQNSATKEELEAAKSKLAELEANYVSKEELNAAKEELLSKVVLLDAFNSYKETVDAKLETLKSDLAKAATKVELAQTQQELEEAKRELAEAKIEIAEKLTSINNTITALVGRLDEHDTQIGLIEDNISTLTESVENLSDQVAQAIIDLGELDGRIDGRLIILETLLGISEGKSSVLDQIQTNLEEQLTKITSNTTDITNLLNEFETLKQDVSTEFENIRNEFAEADKALSERIDALKNNVNNVDKNAKILAQALSLNFATLSNRLTSLTFIPELYVNGIPAMNFSPLRINVCEFAVTPTVIVGYHLNPSFITEEDIEVNNLGFKVIESKNIITRGADDKVPPIVPIFKEIKDGILYVEVNINDHNWLMKYEQKMSASSDTEVFPTVALQVPLSEKAVKETGIETNEEGEVILVNGKEYPENRVVTASQYVRLYSKSMSERDIFLARDLVSDDNTKSYPALATTLDAAKALSVKGIDGATETNPTVVTLPYGAKIDLLPEVIALLKDKSQLPEAYGMKFKFDLNDGEKAIVYERGSTKTDQQQFIELTDADKGTINAKVFDLPAYDAAQGRTPIVRVWMYNETNPDCRILIGFIKIHIADKPLPEAKHVDLTFDTTIPPCDQEFVENVVTVKWMNENVYQQLVKLGKTEFHQIYKLDASEGDGSVEEVANPDKETTDTWLLKWRLATTSIWEKLMNGESAKQTVTVTYRPSVPTQYPLITITFSADFELPEHEEMTVENGRINKDYWFDNLSYVKHNIFVPKDGETDKTKAIFASNLNTGFYANPDLSLKVPFTYEYFFYADQPVMTMNGVKYILKPSADGKQLLYGTEVVATIKPFEVGKGDVLELNRESETAKRLLNHDSEFLKTRIGIYSYYCNVTPGSGFSVGDIKLPVKIAGKDFFDVVFIRPINAEPGHGRHFVDGVSPGQEGSYLKVSELTNLYDWRHRAPEQGNYDSSFEKHPWYYDYYGIENMTVDTKKITTDMDGKVKPVPLSTFPQLEVKTAASINGETPKYGFLTYRNNGNPVSNNFNLYVPVTITYYWGEIVSTTIKVPVNRTITTD